MTWSDPIVDEARRVRDAYAARFNYDLRAIYRDLKEQERRSEREVISRPPEGEPSTALPSIGASPIDTEKVST